jgi:RNA polymerase sigma factor (sigma-70 family)
MENSRNEIIISIEEILTKHAQLLRKKYPTCSFEVNDLVNETCLRLLHNKKSLNQRSHAINLARRIMKCLVIDELRKRYTTPFLSSGGDVAISNIVCKTTSLLDWETHDLLQKAYREDEDITRLLIERYYYGFSFSELSEHLHISAGAFKYRVEKLRTRLRTMFNTLKEE